jgi:hypothetical protein
MRVFRNNTIFDDYLVSQICDEIFSLAPEAVENETFMLTGLAAYFLQRGVDQRQIKNIVFKTTDINVYNLLVYEVGKLNVLNTLKYNNRIVFEYDGQYQRTFIEIWIDAEPTTAINFNGVICEEYSKIKEILL